jgi:hypothetical protein
MDDESAALSGHDETAPNGIHDGVGPWEGDAQANDNSAVTDDGLPRLNLPHLQPG